MARRRAGGGRREQGQGAHAVALAAAVALALTACGGGGGSGDDGAEARDRGGAERPVSASGPSDPCTVVDPQVVATAAGVDVDVADRDATGEATLDRFTTRSCSYDGGQMTISSIAFGGNADRVLTEIAGDAGSNGGTVIDDVDLGALPPSTLVTEVNGRLAVTVLDSPFPFAVGFPAETTEPYQAITAAHAILAVVI